MTEQPVVPNPPRPPPQPGTGDVYINDHHDGVWAATWHGAFRSYTTFEGSETEVRRWALSRPALNFYGPDLSGHENARVAAPRPGTGAVRVSPPWRVGEPWRAVWQEGPVAITAEGSEQEIALWAKTRPAAAL